MAWAPDYVSSVDLAEYLRIDDMDDDVELTLAVAAASRAIDHVTGRQFGQVDTPDTRRYTARPDFTRGYWTVDLDDFILVTGAGVVVTGSGEVTQYEVGPLNAQQVGRPYQRIVFTRESEYLPCGKEGEVYVTALWGWSEIPDTIRQATLLQASRFMKRRDAPFGVAGSPEMGSELRLLAKADPDVSVMVREFSRLRSVF